MKLSVYAITLSMILLLAGLSIYGAFIGAERAQHFFNSIPLSVYWVITAILIILSLCAFRKLHKPALLMMHAGALLVLLGSMAASEKGHQLYQAVTGSEKPVESLMVLNEGKTGNEIYQRSTNRTFQLPFEIHLQDFIVEHYTGTILVQLADGRTETISAEPGAELTLSEMGTTIRVVTIYKNFRMTLKNGQRMPEDSVQPGRNPAVELIITQSDGSVYRQFVFALLKGHTLPDKKLHFHYYLPDKNYISKVEIIRDGVVVKSAAIEVNHPLHYGGFHFYQYSYDDKEHLYTVLKAVSDTGLNMVYAGYSLLCIGAIWYFWFIRLRRR